jgi:hypothetical protein
MSRKKKASITSEKLKDVMARHKANLVASMPKLARPPRLASTPGEPAEFDQGTGGAYNPNGTFPQR